MPVNVSSNTNPVWGCSGLEEIEMHRKILLAKIIIIRYIYI